MSGSGRKVLAVGLGIALAYGLLWIAVRTFSVGWPPAREYEEIPRIERIRDWNESARESGFPLTVDGERVRKIGSRSLGGFIDQHTAYKIECTRAVVDELIVLFAMEARSDPGLRSAFADTFPEAVTALERGAPIVTSPHFVHDGRGPDGDHYAALYDDATSALYLWALHNF